MLECGRAQALLFRATNKRTVLFSDSRLQPWVQAGFATVDISERTAGMREEMAGREAAVATGSIIAAPLGGTLLRPLGHAEVAGPALTWGLRDGRRVAPMAVVQVLHAREHSGSMGAVAVMALKLAEGDVRGLVGFHPNITGQEGHFPGYADVGPVWMPGSSLASAVAHRLAQLLERHDARPLSEYLRPSDAAETLYPKEMDMRLGDLPTFEGAAVTPYPREARGICAAHGIGVAHVQPDEPDELDGPDAPEEGPSGPRTRSQCEPAKPCKPCTRAGSRRDSDAPAD